jgi:hypothetical protein
VFQYAKEAKIVETATPPHLRIKFLKSSENETTSIPENCQGKFVGFPRRLSDRPARPRHHPVR